MDRLHDLSPELDSVGLELPFSEQPERDAELELISTELLAETPYTEVPATEAPRYEGPLYEEPAGAALEFEQETGTRHQFKDCTPAEKTLLIDVAGRALRAVRHATNFVGNAYGNPKKMPAATRQLLNFHFHTVRQRDLLVILLRLRRIDQALDAGIKFTARRKCDLKAGRMYCGYAYNTQWFGGRGRVEICFDTRPQHCNFPKLSSDFQQALVIHEVGHRHVGLDDKAARDEAAYATISADAAMDNADTYAHFAVEAVGALSEAELEQAGEEFAEAGEEFEWPGEEEQDQAEVERLLQAGDTRRAVTAAIKAGERDEGKLTNLVFFFRHPELDRTRPLQPKTSKTDAALAKEWAKIGRSEVWPAIVDFARDPALAVNGQQIAGRITHFRGQAGKRFKALIEAAAKKVDLNPGLLAAALIGEIGTSADYLSSAKVSSYRIGVDDFYELRGILAKNVPAYADIRWDKKQTPDVHPNDAKTKQRLVKTIWFDSGPDALLATAVYLKYAEIRLRSDAAAVGGNFDTLPVETRFALIRMSMAAGRAGARSRLERALKGQDILIRNWAPPKIYQTERNATIRAAEAMFLSNWVFAQPLTATAAVRSQPEQFESAEAERLDSASSESEEFADSEDNEELAWLNYEAGGPGQFFEEEEEEGEEWSGEETIGRGFRESETAAAEALEPAEAERFDPEDREESDEVPETSYLDAGEAPALEVQAENPRLSTITASVGAGGVNRRADVLHVQAALVIRAREDRVALINIDGIVGPKTIAAITDYQRRKALIVDGRVDTGGPTIRSLEDGLIATASALIGAEIAEILHRARHAVLHGSVSAATKEAYRRALGIALALRGREVPVGSVPAPVFAVAVAAAPLVAAGVLEMMMLALLAAMAMLVILQNLPRMGKAADELIRKIQALLSAFLDGIKAHVDSVEDLIRKNTQAGMRCSAELLLFRSLSAQLIAEASAPQLPNPVAEAQRRTRILHLFNKWKAALSALFACLDNEPPDAAFAEAEVDLRSGEAQWPAAEALDPGEAELFDREDREDGEQIREALYDYSGEGPSVRMSELEARGEAEAGLAEAFTPGPTLPTTISPFSTQLYATQMAPDAGHNARLATALGNVRRRLTDPKKQAMLDKIALIIVRLTPSGQMKFAGVREDEMFFSGSLLKVTLLYASFELVERVNALAPHISAASPADFFRQVKLAFDARIAAAVPQVSAGPWQRVAFDRALEAVPTGTGFTVKMNARHRADLARIFADQNQNTAAGNCMHRLGYSFVNGNADAAGFFGVVTQTGIWMAADIGAGWRSFNVPVATGGTSSLAMTALSMANLIAQFKRGQLIKATTASPGTPSPASQEMLAIFQRGGSWLSTLPKPFRDAKSFRTIGAKVGHSPSASARVPWVKSEAALLRRKADGVEFLTVWQNVPDALGSAPIYDVIDEVIRTWP